ncbi:MAG: DUF711 family protein [Pyrodictiaceae archaeon]
MVIVRAVTLLLGDEDSLSLDKVDSIARKASSLLAKLKRCLSENKVKAWTHRIVFPQLDTSLAPSRYAGLTRRLRAVLGEDVLIDPYIIDGEEAANYINYLPKFLQEDYLSYASILCRSWQCLEKVIQALREANMSEDNYTRVAIEIGDWIHTPYFPATSPIPGTTGFAVALRYARDFIGLLEGRGEFLEEELRTLHEKLLNVSKCSGIEFLGIDFSLSPWMEESVALLIEKLSKSPFGAIGTISSIHRLNKLIRELIVRLGAKSIGFNEVMLPVAEDNLLDKRVSEGVVRLADLVYYSVFCVAGVDMVAVNKSSIDPRLLANDLWVVYETKGRPIGVRMIFTDKRPGESVLLRRFGRTHVIKL